ncbi:FAD-binding protein [Pseudomonas sp. LRF_L74]|uniref:FAD-binding protein n=1 Tax=Pseudomonas sp. LRF_L74 TaxID=3369422 RepID=UPI003F63348B
MTRTAERVSQASYDVDLEADVLVIGGSLSGIWAALAAAQQHARVVLVEKGSAGSAGVVAAAGGGGAYIVPGNQKQQRGVLEERHKEAAGLDNLGFLEKVYRQSYASFQRMAEWGYHAPRLGAFGVDSMAFLRRRLKKAGVQVLDHSPALELLRDVDGQVAGAAGVQRQLERTWRVRAGAVILATGGNAFLSGAQGTNGNTGDGYLMAMEAGASLIGMEFASSYALAPLHSSTTKGGMYFQGHAYDERGDRLDPTLPAWFSIGNVADTLLRGGQPFYVLDKVKPDKWQSMFNGVPNFYHYFQRQALNPFDNLWPVTLILEGSVRASGGLSVNEDCSTGVPGLYAVGDLADKSRLVGAFLGGAGPCIAWCVASAEWAAEQATVFARQQGDKHSQRQLHPLGQAGLRPRLERSVDMRARELITRVQTEMLPLETNFYRRETLMRSSLEKLDQIWRHATDDLAGDDARSVLKAREAASLAASGRWIRHAAIERRESRGLHRHADYPQTDLRQCHHLRVRGLDQVVVSVSQQQSAD